MKNRLLITVLLTVVFFPILTFSLTVDEIKNTTTIVLLNEEEQSLNVVIKEVLDKEWGLTKLHYMMKSEFKKDHKQYRGDLRYSFFVIESKPDTRKLILTKQVKKNGEVKYMSFTPKVKLKVELNPLKKQESSVQIVEHIGTGTEISEFDYTYKAEFTKDILFIKHCLFKTSPYLNSIDSSRYNVRKLRPELKEKTLYIPQSITNGSSLEYISKYYPFKIQIVSSEVISNAILNRRKDVIYYDCYKSTMSTYRAYFFNAEDGSPVYSSPIKETAYFWAIAAFRDVVSYQIKRYHTKAQKK